MLKGPTDPTALVVVVVAAEIEALVFVAVPVPETDVVHVPEPPVKKLVRLGSDTEESSSSSLLLAPLTCTGGGGGASAGSAVEFLVLKLFHEPDREVV